MFLTVKFEKRLEYELLIPEFIILNCLFGLNLRSWFMFIPRQILHHTVEEIVV